MAFQTLSTPLSKPRPLTVICVCNCLLLLILSSQCRQSIQLEASSWLWELGNSHWVKPRASIHVCPIYVWNPDIWASGYHHSTCCGVTISYCIPQEVKWYMMTWGVYGELSSQNVSQTYMLDPHGRGRRLQWGLITGLPFLAPTLIMYLGPLWGRGRRGCCWTGSPPHLQGSGLCLSLGVAEGQLSPQ